MFTMPLPLPPGPAPSTTTALPVKMASLSYGVTAGGPSTELSSPFQIATGMGAQFTKSRETKWP